MRKYCQGYKSIFKIFDSENMKCQEVILNIWYIDGNSELDDITLHNMCASVT